MKCILQLVRLVYEHKIGISFTSFKCYLLLMTEICMNKPNHNQFHTCIVTSVD